MALGLGIVAPLVARTWLEGRAELAQAAEAEIRGDVEQQIIHLGRAARWRMPLASHDDAAIDALLTIDDPDHALAACREARRALLGSRVAGVSRPDALQRANACIDERTPQSPNPVGSSPNPGPTPWLAAVASIAFTLWVVSTGLLLARGLDGKGRLVPKPAVRWGAVSLVALVGWMLALRLA